MATNTGQCAVLLLTGSLSSSAALTVPSVEWQWSLVKNSTGQTVTVKTAAGTGVAIPNGRQVPVFCDGADCSFAGANYIGANITETNDRDVMDKGAVATAIASAALPATAGTVLNSITDTTAGYLSGKITPRGLLSKSTDSPSSNEALNIETALYTAIGTDNYVITPSPAFTAYATNMAFLVLFTNANTGASTLNVSGLGAKAICKNISTALISGDIAAGVIAFCFYDGTRFQIAPGLGATSTLSDSIGNVR